MDDIRDQAFISYALENNLTSRPPGPDGSRRGRVQLFRDELTRELVGNAACRILPASGPSMGAFSARLSPADATDARREAPCRARW